MAMKMTKSKLREIIKYIIREEKTAYQKFFDKALAKFKVTSPKQLKGDKEKEFYDYVDKGWKADNETD